MRLSERVYDTFVSHAKNPLFEFFSSSYPITRSDEVRPTFNEDLENAIKAELAHYPSLGSKIVTYAQVYPWVMHLGNRLELATQAGDLIGLSLQDHAFWYTAEFSIIGSQRGAVGSYSGWSAQDIFDTWALSNVSLVIIDQMVLDKLIKSQLKWPDTVKKIILMSDAAVDLSPYAVLLSKIKLESIVIDYFSSPQVDLRTGRNQFREEMFSNQFDENNTALVIFTSGTSGGKPKGIAYSHKRWSEGKPNFRNMDPMISVHEPSWSTGKHTMWTSFLSGGKISFIPKQSHLFEINRLVHPERAVFVPFQARELYSMYLDFFEKEQNRLARYSNKPEVISDQAEANAIYYVHEYLLGGNVQQITVGGAAVSTEILTFLKKLPCNIAESYGQTESRGLLRNGYPQRGMQLKLVSLPEMGYSVDDRPYPRGQIAVKSSQTTPASDWICDESERRVIQQRYMNDGFLLTGDIAEQRPDGTYVIVDRVSSLQKLDNGKYISPERIENVISPQSILLEFGPSPSACFVTLNASRSATIVMFRFEKPIAEKQRINLEKELFSKVKSVCRINGISESEIPVKLIIDDIDDGGWSLENGILNRSLKLIRHVLHSRLENIVTKQSNNNAAVNSIASLDYPKTPVELASWLLRKLKPEGNSFNERMLTSSLTHIGFDSMQLAQMGALLPELLNELHTMGCMNIKKLHNKHFATPLLMQHSMLSLAQALWNENPEESLGKEPKEEETSLLERLAEIEKNSMHQLQQLKTMTRLEPSKMKHKPHNTSSTTKMRVLVTGGAGFLGAHIVRDLLNASWVSEVICLVRGLENEDAASRVRRIVLTGHESLGRVYSKKVTVINGDLSSDKFGLPDSNYEKLVHDGNNNPAIDLIIHAAAMVKSWKLEEGLDVLTEPNVKGTMRIAQLAFEVSQYRVNQQLTPVVYVSTNSVSCNEVCSQDNRRIAQQKGWFSLFQNEDRIKRNLNAYAATKLMAEQILRESGLPLTIVRAPLLTWNTKTGYGNNDDWLNRLVDACISTKMIPQFDPIVSANSMPVNQSSALIVKNARYLIKNAGNNPFSIEYPYQGIPGLQLRSIFEKLEKQACANGVNMKTMSVEDWSREMESISQTHPTRFTPLLATLSSIVNRRSETHKVSKMEGVELWLKELLSAHTAMSSNVTSPLKGLQKFRIGFFQSRLPREAHVIPSLTEATGQENLNTRIGRR